MSPLEILLKRKSDEASLTAMTSGLRRNQDIAAISMLSGDPILGQFGQGLAQRGEDRTKMYIGQREKADQRALTQGYYEQLASQATAGQEHRGKVLTETIRSNKETERIAELKAIRGLKKSPPATAAKKTNQTIQAVVNLGSLIDKFQDEYASDIGFGEGTISNFLGKTPLGTQAQENQSLWWSEYQQMYELGTRNELFGSALTAQEIAAWKKANISENSTPSQIRSGLDIMMGIARDKANQQYKSDSPLYYDDWVNSVYSPLMGKGSPPPAGAESSPPQEGTVMWSDLP